MDEELKELFKDFMEDLTNHLRKKSYLNKEKESCIEAEDLMNVIALF